MSISLNLTHLRQQLNFDAKDEIVFDRVDITILLSTNFLQFRKYQNFVILLTIYQTTKFYTRPNSKHLQMTKKKNVTKNLKFVLGRL